MTWTASRRLLYGTGSSAQGSVGWGGGIREGGPKGRDTGMRIAGPLRCTAETNTAFQSNYARVLSLSLSCCFFSLFFLTIFKIVRFQINFSLWNVFYVTETLP